VTDEAERNQAAKEEAGRAEELRRAALGKEYQEGLDRAGEAYSREQARLAEERKAEIEKGQLKEAWEARREQQTEEERRAADMRAEEARREEAVRQAEQEAREEVQHRLEAAKQVRSRDENAPVNRPPTWEQVKAAEQTRRDREERSLLDWQEADRQAVIRRAGEGGWPQEELVEKLRSQAETHAKQHERQVREQQERLERLRLTNGQEQERKRGRTLKP
jgi:hypothetical protein